MLTRITDSKDKTYPTRIPAKAQSGSPLGIAVYVQNISMGTISLKLNGMVYIGGKIIKDLNFDVSYENVMPGVCCLFTDEFVMPRSDVVLRLTSYHEVGGEYRKWEKDSVTDYEIATILPPPPPPEFIDISISFSEAEPISVERRYFRP